MNKLDKARGALDGFERGFGSEASVASDPRLLNELATGLGLLDEIANEGTPQSQVAVDIGTACFKKTCELISTRFGRGPETVENLKMLGNVLEKLNRHGFSDGSALLNLQVNVLRESTHKYLQFRDTDEMKEFNQRLFEQADKVRAFLMEQRQDKMEKVGNHFHLFDSEPDDPDDAA